MTIHPQTDKKINEYAPKTIPNAASSYWSVELKQLQTLLNSSTDGLQPTEADKRLKQYGLNTIGAQQKATALRLLLSQFKSPLVLILIAAALVSGVLGEWVDTTIILVIVLSSTILGFVQEYTAGNAVEKLRSQVTLKSNVLRAGKVTTIPSDQVVPGDVVILSAGSLIPADGVVLEADDFFVNQAVLTGETYPSEKKVATVAANASLTDRINSVFMGTSVSSGTARVIIAQTGKATVFGQVAEKLRLRPPETEFERGIRRFGNMLTQVMLVMVVIVLSANILMKKPVVDSLLFALALAVGLTPELLPAIISIMLSHGAQKMAKRGVIVRRLTAIENFGSMDFLCTDKTGTLTEGVVSLDGAMDAQGQPSDDVLRFAYLNANFQAGLVNALDEAIQASAAKAKLDITAFQKVDEIPYDFIRKRLSVVVADPKGDCTLVTKGALDNVLTVCTNLLGKDGTHPLDAEARKEINQLYSDWSEKGYRVLGLATKPIDKRSESYTNKDEAGLSFTGFLLFFDPPKKDVEKVILDLLSRGVQLKIITGDNQKVALHVANAVKLPMEGTLTGSQLNDLNDEALWHLAEKT
ncbi:MAG: HAD-IC family P-type ATPase, partial [Anaerolineaceae bacterium]